MWCAALVSGALLAAAPPIVVADPVDPPDVWTFERVREKVLDWGVGLQEARFRSQRASLGQQDAARTFLPSLNLTAGVLAGTLEDRDPVDVYVGVRASPILEGYEKFFARRLAELEARAGRLAESEAREQLLSRARQSYLTLIALASARRHLLAAVGHAQRLVEMAGVESEPELAAARQLEAALVLQRERMNLRALDDRRAREELTLKTLLGLAPDAPFAIDAATPPASVLPELAAAGQPGEGPGTADSPDSQPALDLELARQQLRLSRFERFPQPFLRVGLSRGGFEVRSGAYVFAGFDVPLLDWGRRSRQRARAAVGVAEKERELARATLERRAQIFGVALERSTLERQQSERRQCVELAERRLQALLALYQQGRIAAGELARTQIEVARERAELAISEGASWTALCRHDALQRAGVASAP